MEQNVYIDCDGDYHSKLHAAGVEHVHTSLKKPIYDDGPEGGLVDCIEGTVEFSEKNAAGWLELSPDHKYRFDKYVKVPDLASGGLRYDKYREKIAQENINVGDEIQHAFENAVTVRLNIDDILVRIKQQSEMLESPEAREIVERERARLAAARERSAAEEKAAEAKREYEYAKIAAEETARKSAKAEWIAENGSERLRKAYTNGYRCQELFAAEVRSWISPQIVLDKHGKIEYEERTCPTLEALKRCEELEKISPFITKPRVVWLRWGLTPIESTIKVCEAVRMLVDGIPAYELVEPGE